MQIIHILSFHERSNLENKTKDKLLSMVFIDPIYFMNSLFNFASFHSTSQPKVVKILIELINKSYRNQNLPVVRNVKVFFRKIWKDEKCENSAQSHWLPSPPPISTSLFMNFPEVTRESSFGTKTRIYFPRLYRKCF